MRGELLYVIGPPGAGKTTMLAALTDGAEADDRTEPFAHTVWATRSGAKVAQLGPRRTPFGGTDGLAMNALPTVIDWMRTRPHDLVIGEGDRLACDRFFIAVGAAGYRLAVVAIHISESASAALRAARSAEHGTGEQNAAWVKGRRTKALRLADDWATARIPGPPNGVPAELERFRCVQAFA